MLTLFTTAKPFKGHNAIIQRNALRSWKLLHPDIEVILFGDEEGAAGVAGELGIRHEPYVERFEGKLPYVNFLFNRAQEIARHDYLCYANCDMILMKDFLRALEKTVQWRKRFLLVSQRWDTDITELIDFDRADWDEEARRASLARGFKQDPRFVDFFVFPKGAYSDIPPLVVGISYWDWWVVWNTLSRRIPVVDCTPYVTAIHQNHDYAHYPGGKVGTHLGPVAMQNYRLAGGSEHFRWTEDATHRLTRGGRISRKFIRTRYRTRAKDFWLEARRIFTYKVWLPVWFFLLGITRPLRNVLGLRSEAVRRSHEKP
jgi:hypothetical protein